MFRRNEGGGVDVGRALVVARGGVTPGRGQAPPLPYTSLVSRFVIW